VAGIAPGDRANVRAGLSDTTSTGTPAELGRPLRAFGLRDSLVCVGGRPNGRFERLPGTTVPKFSGSIALSPPVEGEAPLEQRGRHPRLYERRFGQALRCRR
jgi:hypothetical protein